MHKEEPSITAKICALSRAHHSQYAEDKIFDDYLAFDLLGAQEYKAMKNLIIQILSSNSWQIPFFETWDSFLDELIAPIILTRIHYAEEELLAFAEANRKVQYVICGAGMDSFAFRNKNKNIKVFELDHPNTHKYKLNRIKELGWKIPENVQYVDIDFETHNLKEVLLKTGFQPGVKTFFTLLGVSYYLTADVLTDTFIKIAELSAKGSRLIFDYPEKRNNQKVPERFQILMDITESLGEKMTGGMVYDELRTELKKVNYHIKEHLTPGRIQERYLYNRGNRGRAFENVSFIMSEYGRK